MCNERGRSLILFLKNGMDVENIKYIEYDVTIIITDAIYLGHE